MRKVLLVTWLLLALVAAGSAQQPAAQPTDARRESFDIVWRTVKEKHFDPTFGGVDWDRVRQKYEPRLSQIKTDAELYDMLEEMLGELHQSHFGIIPPDAITAESREAATGGVGLDLRLIDDRAVITRVDADSPAARAGLRSGFVITKVDDLPVAQVSSRLRKAIERPAMAQLYIERRVMGHINGKPTTPVRLEYLDERDQPHSISLVREARKGEMSPAFANLPPQYTEFEARRLAGNIGYIRFNVFVMPIMPRVRAAIREARDAAGLIIDLRGNPGGIGGLAIGMAGLLAARQDSLGTMKMREGELKFVFSPQENAYAGKVVILVDGDSASTSEIFAAGLQELGRAVVVGERSLGAALPSVIQKLPTGALFQYAIADFKTPKGVLIEGRGVIPDLDVKRTRAALLAGHDAQLDAAVERILKQ
ncbi:MAG TPA: S41 family peptidase [Blastocatellia bacterium]|nr:S41 family peptidase [Blastocatellia bacterium]